MHEGSFVIVLLAIEDAMKVQQPDLRAHALSRLEFLAAEDLLGGDTPSSVIVMKPGDRAEDLRPELGFDVLATRYSDIRFDEHGYSSPFETVEEYPTFFELVLVLSDYGDGVVLLVPKEEGIDADLHALCSMHATPAKEPSS